MTNVISDTKVINQGLRRAAYSLRQQHLERRFPAALVLSDFDQTCVDFPIAEEVTDDIGLRTEVIDALVTRALTLTPRPAVLLTRPGSLETQALDLTWLTPCVATLRSYDVEPLAVAVVTKDGWSDPFTGVQRVWKRLRIRKHWYPPGHPLRKD